MFNISKDILALAVRDRTLIILTFIGTVLALVIIISGILTIRPSDIQVPVRYSAYGATYLYREKWYYLLSFLAAGGLFLIMHPLITLKIWQEKGRDFAIGFSTLTLLVTFIGVLITSAVLRVVSVSL